MNGLIQHLATSGLDLSEDNVLGVSSRDNQILFESYPIGTYALAIGGMVIPSDDWKDCWGIGMFQLKASGVLAVWIITHGNDTGRTVIFASGTKTSPLILRYLTPTGAVYQDEYPARLYLKSI